MPSVKLPIAITNVTMAQQKNSLTLDRILAAMRAYVSETNQVSKNPF